jgi:Zn-dependent metalloprotease
MKKRTGALLAVLLATLMAFVFGAPGLSESSTLSALRQLEQDTGSSVEITWNPRTDTPSFVRGSMPLSGARVQSEDDASAWSLAFLDHYAGLFGIQDASHELTVVQTETDALGMSHVTFSQVYQGIEVYGASIKTHLSADGQKIAAISSGFVPGIQVASVEPWVSAEQALATARGSLAGGELTTDPRLVVYPGASSSEAVSAQLAWLVELRDDAVPARKVYVIDAIDGYILDALDRIYDWSRSRDLQRSNSPEAVAQAPCPPASCTPGRDVGREFFVQVVQRLADVPVDEFAVEALVAWEPHENTSACWNPLATTWKMPGSCDFNTATVQHYLTEDMGAEATANTLNQGYYDAIRRMLRLEAFDREALRAALGTWGTCSGQGCDSLLNRWQELWNARLSRDRKTYDADHTMQLPGTLVRAEGDVSTGDQDVDNAHDFAGATYNYYWQTHGRDSYDGQGATLVSTANYGNSYMNAFWNGEQTVYGDSFAVNDVVAHEWTHAVTEHTAKLEYRWQSGALNESFSDIFGAMVDRDDWLMGEDLPPDALGGREAIRDLSDPTRFGQPAHTDDWVETCSDNEGVHTNCGITNKAYYNIATAIGKDKAERIFYRTLTVYLVETSSLEDARAGALQSAQVLYGEDSAEYAAVRDGFDAVGLDGHWQPPENNCACGASVALTAEPDGQDLLSDLRAVRDQVFTRNPGRRWTSIYYEHQIEVAWLLISDSQSRAEAQAGFRTFGPVFRALLEGDEASSEVILTQETIQAAERALMDVAEKSSPAVREDIIQEWNRIDPYRFVGWDVASVKRQLLLEEAPYRILMPLVVE